ncbi:Hypothetical Protein RRSL_00927 [Ralstonia solanacearum UW551]|uniref:Uncharacterized protein n=1 Tax=Ralstonia solanacearum (strain UW551) TaxID=342110 RepID=A0AB33V8X2_RALSU|nr:Hypothetical Protein RRSL_00927 [Ralstonia solanacearum UW551]
MGLVWRSPRAVLEPSMSAPILTLTLPSLRLPTGCQTTRPWLSGCPHAPFPATPDAARAGVPAVCNRSRSHRTHSPC